MPGRSLFLVLGILAVTIIIADVRAEVRRVRAEYATIQSAFNAVNDGDTVLVSLGTYAEELLAPPLHFWLIGDVEIDTGNFERPVIDPSTLDSAQWRKCLFVPEGCELIVERMSFLNHAAMYPRPEFRAYSGVVSVTERPLTFRYCAFDSLYGGIVQWPADNAANFIVEDCQFTRANQLQIFTSNGGVAVFRSFFKRRRGGFVYGRDHSIVQDCIFMGDSISHAVKLYGHDLQVRNNVFGPMDSCYEAVLAINNWSDAIVEGNLFQDVRSQSYEFLRIVRMDSTAAIFCQNVLRNISGVGEFATPAIFVYRYAAAPLGCSAVIENNMFEDFNSEWYPDGGKAITLTDEALIAHNRFMNLLPGTLPSVALEPSNPAAAEMRYNQFEADDYAVYSPSAWVDAIWNYWGDPTGPYNAINNPQGLGARVDNLVSFDPWFPDTNFQAVEPRSAAIPLALQLELHPNPFNSQVQILFELDHAATVELSIFDLTGRLVRNLVHDVQSAGRHSAVFDGSDLASGVYFVRLEANQHSQVRKLVLIR